MPRRRWTRDLVCPGLYTSDIGDSGTISDSKRPVVLENFPENIPSILFGYTWQTWSVLYVLPHQRHHWPVISLKCCYFKMVKPTQKTRDELSHWIKLAFFTVSALFESLRWVESEQKRNILAGTTWLSLGLRMSSQNTPRARNKLFAHAWVRCNSSTPKPETSTLYFPSSSLKVSKRQKREKKTKNRPDRRRVWTLVTRGGVSQGQWMKAVKHAILTDFSIIFLPKCNTYS